MVNYKKILLAVFLGLSLVKAAFSFDRIVNYSATNCINAFAADGDIIWVATTGGLYRYNRSNGAGTLYSDPVLFPDPEITVLCVDARHTLWAGTAKGYIYKRTPQDKQTVINAYFMSGWRITALDTAGRYLIIGTNNGCSLFDTDKLTVIKNATGFAEGFPTQVNAIATVIDTLRIKNAFHFRDSFHLRDTIHLLDTLHLKDTDIVRDTFLFRDTTILGLDTTRVFRDTLIHQEMLLLGTDKGIVRLYDTGKAILGTLANANFYDRTIWTIDLSHSTAVRSIVAGPGGFSTFAGPAAMFKNRTVYGDSSTIYADSQKIDTFRCKVTALYTTNNQECLVGTARTGFFIWNGTTAPRAVKIDGPSFSMVTNIQVDREGITWVSPQVVGNGISVPWEGFSAFRNGYWQIYSPVDFFTIGGMGDLGKNKGAAEDCLGNMWFGTEGGSVKRYNRANNSWRTYCIYASTEGAGFEPSPNGICGASNWAMSDAITADSTGFLWISCLNNFAGSLICYDPKFEPVPNAPDYQSAHYRRFWPNGDPYYASESPSISVITTDVANNILVGYTNGQIVVFRHNGNPLKDGIQVVTFSNQAAGKILAAVSTPDSLTRIAFAGGFYTFDPRNNTFHKGLWAWTVNPQGLRLALVDSAIKGISAIEAEDENVLWLGTLDSGILRYDLAINRAAGGDVTKVLPSKIDETQGLLSNHITGLSIDRKGGYLWIASDRGVSRYAIGYQIGAKNSGPPVVYPVPFSKRRHREMVFEKLPPESTVLLYTVSGSLVASVSTQETGVYGSACVWKPSPTIVPGIYLFVIRSKTKTTQGRVIITP